MSNASPVPSGQLPSPAPLSTPDVNDRQQKLSSQDVSSDQKAPESVSKKPNLTQISNVPGSLNDVYNSSITQLPDPSLTLSGDDIISLSVWSNDSLNSDGTQAANNTAASGILAIQEVYLQNQKRLDTNYNDPGATHQDVTPQFQQKIGAQKKGVTLPSVPPTANSPLPGHQLLKLLNNYISQKRSGTSSGSGTLSTSTWSSSQIISSEQYLDQLIGDSNNQSSLNRLNVQTESQRNASSKRMLDSEDSMKSAASEHSKTDSRGAAKQIESSSFSTTQSLKRGSAAGSPATTSANPINVSQALKKGFGTLSIVTAQLRPKPLGPT
jgi:hypothetical protein